MNLTSTWKNELEQYARVTGKTLVEAVREQAGYLLVDLLKLTPPCSASFSEPASSQRKRGLKTIETDIKKQFPSGPEVSERAMTLANGNRRGAATIRRYVREKQYQKLDTFLRKITGGKVEMAANGIATEPEHDRNRSMKGRVSGKRFVAWSPVNIRDVTREVQKRVGYGKSGWLPCFRQLGVKVPAGYGWVQRAAKQAGGFSMFDKNPVTPSVTVANAAPHGFNLLKLKEGSGGTLVERCIKMRASKMGARIAYLLRKPKGKL
jgi:hypothetical protein